MAQSKSQMEELEKCLKSVQEGINNAKEGQFENAEQILRELQNRYAEVTRERQQNKMAS